MKAAIPITNGTLLAPISQLFARSAYFGIVDLENLSFEFFKNPYETEKLGVGKKIVQFLADENKVTTFIAFELGLNLQQFAAKRNIQFIILQNDILTFADIIKLLANNSSPKLEVI